MSATETNGAESLDPAETAQAELRANTVPTPEDVLADVGQFAALWYVRETAYYAMRLWAASVSATGGDDLPDDSEPVRALAALSLACGELDAACALVGLLPSDYADDATA